MGREKGLKFRPLSQTLGQQTPVQWTCRWQSFSEPPFLHVRAGRGGCGPSSWLTHREQSPSRLALIFQAYQVFQALKGGLWAPLHARHKRLLFPLEHPAGIGMLTHSLAPFVQPSSRPSAGGCPPLSLPIPRRPSSPCAGSSGPVWLSETLPSVGPRQTQGWESQPSPGAPCLKWQ